MKKKLLSVLLAVTLMASMLAGCGEKEDNKEDKAVENVQEDGDEVSAGDATEEDTTDSNVVDLGNGMMMEYPGEDDGLIELEGEVTVIEEDEDVQADAESEWATAYDDYFTREDIIPENMKMSASAEMEGISMDIVVATVGESSYMRYAFDSAILDLYATADKIYVRTEMAGQESWMFAPVTSEEDMDSVMSLASETAIVDAEKVTSCTYVEEIEENGVIYDVLLLEVNDEGITGDIFYYVNRDTQKVDKFTMEQDGQFMECFVEEADAIELPAEADNAVEGTMGDVAGALFAVILSAVDAGM
jgi:hypothetical protein